jgi:hypothetical protein
MQTSEEGVQQTELKSSPSNPFRNPQQQHQQQTIYPPPYQSASIQDSSDCDKSGDFTSSFSKFKRWMIGWRGSRRLVLVIVAIALLLDNMLLTVVGEYLFNATGYEKTIVQSVAQTILQVIWQIIARAGVKL